MCCVPALGMNSLAKIKRIAAIAETHYVAIAPYHGGGPIGAWRAFTWPPALPNFYIQQIPDPGVRSQDAAMRAELTSGQQRSRRERDSPLC